MDGEWMMVPGLFSLIGFAVFTYGRKQRRSVPLIGGIALMVYPYFVSSTLALVGVGVLFIAGMFVANRFESDL